MYTDQLLSYSAEFVLALTGQREQFINSKGGKNIFHTEGLEIALITGNPSLYTILLNNFKQQSIYKDI